MIDFIDGLENCIKLDLKDENGKGRRNMTALLHVIYYEDLLAWDILDFRVNITLNLKVVFRNNSVLIFQTKSKLQLDNTFEQKENVISDLYWC